jgi:hypothetical protein
MYAIKVKTKQTRWHSGDGHLRTGIEITSEMSFVLNVHFTLCAV